MKYFGFVVFICLVPFAATTQDVTQDVKCPDAALKVLSGAKKLILMTADSWDKSSGQIELYDRSSTQSKWQNSYGPVASVFGSKGLGWGHEYVSSKTGQQPVKHEGDGKTPAGIFKIGRKFGFEPSQGTNNYLQLKKDTVCVDDTASAHYNQIVEADTEKDWNSAEQMKKIELYKKGVEVLYTSSAAQKAGSCIFLHVWRNQKKGTAGCGAMSLETMNHLHSWMQDSAEVAVVVLPRIERENNWAACLPKPQALSQPNNPPAERAR